MAPRSLFLDEWLSGLLIVEQATGACDTEDKPLIYTMMKLRKRLILEHRLNRRDQKRDFPLNISATIVLERVADKDQLMWCGLSNGDDTIVLVEQGLPGDRRFCLYANGPRGTEVLLPLAVVVI